MPFYNYKVKTETGAQQAGKVEAVSMEKAATILQEKGLFIVSLTPVREGVLASFFATGKMKFDEVVVFILRDIGPHAGCIDSDNDHVPQCLCDDGRRLGKQLIR